ncbi:MAG: hypothetical protein U0175_18960 [Caldilineaceae bacterium]
MNRLSQPQHSNPTYRIAVQFGFWMALLLAVATTVAFGIAITTMPISGPFCVSDCVTYPYETVADHVPGDYIWMVPGALIAPIVVILMVCIHHYAAVEKKLFSQIGVIFAAIYTALIAVDYYIQLAVIQPSLLRSEFEGIALISQYNPHSIFIALEDLGYVMLALTFLLIAPVFTGKQRLSGVLRWLFRISSLLALGGFVLYHLIYGYNLEYRFEVFVIAVDWVTLIVAGVLVAIFFRSMLQKAGKGV